MEKEILGELTNRLVMSKEEIMKFVEGKSEDSGSVLDSALRSLLEKGYATNITPLGSGCYAVTTKGIRAVRHK